MSRLTEAIKNKNKIGKKAKEHRIKEIQTIREKNAFKAKLYEQLQGIDALLDNGVESVKIEVASNVLWLFSETIYSSELNSFNIQQINENTFSFSRKYISI